ISRISSEIPNPKSEVPFGYLDHTGVYLAEGTAQRTFAVNLLDATESALATSDELKLGGRVVSANDKSPVARELWPWFLIAASLLLAAEWLLYAWRARA